MVRSKRLWMPAKLSNKYYVRGSISIGATRIGRGMSTRLSNSRGHTLGRSVIFSGEFPIVLLSACIEHVRIERNFIRRQTHCVLQYTEPLSGSILQIMLHLFPYLLGHLFSSCCAYIYTRHHNSCSNTLFVCFSSKQLAKSSWIPAESIFTGMDGPDFAIYSFFACLYFALWMIAWADARAHRCTLPGASFLRRWRSM